MDGLSVGLSAIRVVLSALLLVAKQMMIAMMVMDR